MIQDFIIIGGGPAGITAGIYASRHKLNTLLITKSFGGQMVNKAVEIENYPGFEEISGLELLKKFESHLKKQPLVSIERTEVVRLKKTDSLFLIETADKKEFKAKAVVIASGTDPRPLEVPGEKEYIGRGVSYCVVCDGPLFSDKTVAVIGGGNAGFETAIFLARYAEKIYILESGQEIKADKANQRRAEESQKIEIVKGISVKEVKGGEFVNFLVCQKQGEDKETKISVDGVFVAIGHQPATSFVKDLVDFNERDEIKVEFETCQTKTPGLFAAGDVNVGKYKQIVTACGEGAKAALAAFDYLQKLES